MVTNVERDLYQATIGSRTEVTLKFISNCF